MVEGAICHLPSTSTDLFGRDAELAWLDACWRDGVFVASIVAWGGVGKTSLVTKWLAKMRDDGWRGAERIFDWSFYRQGTNTAGSSDTFFAETLCRFGDPDPTAGSPWDKGERLAKLVQKKRTLLVLDGVEPMQYGPGEQEGHFKDPALQTLVKELSSNNNGLLLITSRLQLTDVDGMSGAKVQTKALDHLSADAGAALLRARGAKGTDEELQKAANEYRGHALALTLLGSYLEDVAEGDIRRRNEIGPLHYDERNGGHARRVIEAYELWVGKTELAILRMLGLFDRPATEGELIALRADPVVPSLTDVLMGVTGRDWNKAVSKLRRIHLIATELGASIDAHPLVRQHFCERLKNENLDAFREGHRRLYEFLRMNTTEFPETIAEMEPLYKAVVHGCLAGMSQVAFTDVCVKRIRRGEEGFSWRKLGAFSSDVVMFSAFFDPPWERLASGLDKRSEGFVLNGAGFRLRALGRLQEAAVLFRLALPTIVALEDWKNAAICAANISELLQAGGDLCNACEAARQSVELADKSEDILRRVTNRARLAMVGHAMGLRQEAAGLFVGAEQLQREHEPEPLLYSLPGFWYCDLLLEESREGDVRQRAALTQIWAVATMDLLENALDHLTLGRAHLLRNQWGTDDNLTEANSHIRQAVDGLRKASQEDYLALGLLARAELYIHTRAFADARRDLDEAMTIAARCGFRLHEADARLGYARLALAESKLGDARKHIEKARTIINESGYHRRDRDLAELEAMTKNQLHDALCKLLDSELKRLFFKLDVPTSVLPGENAPAADRVTELLTWAGNPDRNRLGDVEQAYLQLMGVGASAGSTRHAAPVTVAAATPTPSPKLAAQDRVDLGVVIALQDEFRDFAALCGPLAQQKDDVLTAYRFERGAYRGVATFVGDMGEAHATRVTERMISLYQPQSIVVIGIAAGVHDDLRVGDVYVPPQAVQYIQDAKAVPKKGKPAEFTIVPGAPAYRPDHVLLEAVRHLEFGAANIYRNFYGNCAKDLETLVPDASVRNRLVAEDLVRREIKLLADGHVATGPVVGAAPAFSAWIRSHDRNVKALEMESAAVLLAAQTRATATRALAIRGISDYGDDRKKALDEIGEGALRKYAMRNAVRFLWALLEANALPR